MSRTGGGKSGQCVFISEKVTSNQCLFISEKATSYQYLSGATLK